MSWAAAISPSRRASSLGGSPGVPLTSLGILTTVVPFLEANPNPEIAEDEEFASSAEAAGVSYEELLEAFWSSFPTWLEPGPGRVRTAVFPRGEASRISCPSA